MDFVSQFKSDIFNTNSSNFDDKCLQAFQYQYNNNVVYRQFTHFVFGPNYLPKNRFEIPFLPISFFKTHQIISGNNTYNKIFESSGTTGQVTSKHYVKDTLLYDKISVYIFEKLFFKLSNTVILPLLPSYSERSNSSLVWMVKHLMTKTGQDNQDFYLYNFKDLDIQIKKLSSQNKHILLFGVTFALLDWAEQTNIKNTNLTIIETGGMKGRKNELIREEVHAIIRHKLPNATIASEYGMTELLSQGYAKDGHHFETPAWMQILIRDVSDPLLVSNQLPKGGLNVIDLANIDSVCFIETEDLVEKSTNNTYKVIGRINQSDLRGCNLMYA